MESNKSKGVNTLEWYANRLLHDLDHAESKDEKHRLIWCALYGYHGEKESTRLAHPQQSEGAGQAAEGAEHSVYLPIRYDSRSGWFLDDAGRIIHGSIVAKYANKQFELLEAQPSEPAALKDGDDPIEVNVLLCSNGVIRYDSDVYVKKTAPKEFYCIGNKDNLFQCEEQCEDCKKGAALKEPQGNDQNRESNK